MDDVANVTKQQPAQASSQDVQRRTPKTEKTNTQNTTEILKQVALKDKENVTKINSEGDVSKLVSQLNKALLPISTDIQFAVDKDDIFFVSIHEKESNRFIRRFPAEKAADFLPKIQEVTGVLFDTIG